MKKIYLILVSILSLPVFSQDKPVQRIDDNVAAPHSSTKQAPDDTNVYNTAGLDVLPEFPGGVMAFQKIFDTGVDKSAIKGPDGKTFKVYASFIIEKDGTMTEEKVLRDQGFGLGRQVLDLLEKTKVKWSPGKIGGKPVRVLYHFPVTIKKEDNNNRFNDTQSSETGDISIKGEDIVASPTVDYVDKSLVKGPDYIHRMSDLKVKPEYPGGDNALKQEVLENLKTHYTLNEKGKTVRAYISFVVEKDGNISNIKCPRDPGYGIGKELEKAVQKLKKKWSPGIENGKPVRVQYSLPLIIEVPKDEK